MAAHHGGEAPVLEEVVAQQQPSQHPQQPLPPVIQRAISPPTPAPSPRPGRVIDGHQYEEGRSQTPPFSAEDSSLAAPAPPQASPAGVSSGMPFNTQTLIKQVTSEFATLNRHARLDLLSALVGHCSVQELAHLSRIISPRLRVDFLSELPIEVSLHILSFVDDPRTLSRAAGVSRFWRSLVNDEQTWMAMCVKHKYRTRKIATQSALGTPMHFGKGKQRADELDELRSEAEEANILPSLYERYRARGLDPSNAMQELRTLHATFLSKQESGGGEGEQLSPQDIAFYAQLEEIVREEIRDRYGKTQADLRTPLHERYIPVNVNNDANSASLESDEQRAATSNVGRLSAAPSTSLTSSSHLQHALSPSQGRRELYVNPRPFPRRPAPSATLQAGPSPSTLPIIAHEDNMDTDTQEVLAPSREDRRQSNASWWGGAAAAASAAVAQTPTLAGTFASWQHHHQTTPQGQGFVPSFAAITPTAAANLAANFLGAPSLRQSPVAGLGNAFTHGLHALGLERSSLMRFAGASPSERHDALPEDDSAATPIGFYDGDTMSFSTNDIEHPRARHSPHLHGAGGFAAAAGEQLGRTRPKRARPQSSLGLGVPSTSESSVRPGNNERAVSYTEGLSRSNREQQPFSYKEHFKVAYQTESNWLKGGRLLSQHASADERILVTSMAMDSDWIVLGMSNCKIHIFDARTGLFSNTLIGHASGVWCLSVVSGRRHGHYTPAVQQETMVVTNPDDNGGRPSLAAGQGDLRLLHHDARPMAGQTPAKSSAPTSDVEEDGDETLAWFHKARIAMLRKQGEAGDGDHMMMDEDVQSPQEPLPDPGFFNSSSGSTAGQGNPTGSVRGYGNLNSLLVSAGCDREIRVWDLGSGTCKHVLRGHTATVRCLKVFDGRPIAVSGSRDSTVRVWNIETGTLIHLLQGHERSVRCVEVAGNKIASASYDATCRVWDVDTGECLHVLTGHCHQIYTVAFDGEKVATGSLDSTVRVWNAHTGECLALFQGHTSLVGQLQLTDKVLVTGGSDGRVIVFSLENYECIHRICAHDNSVTCLQFDDRFIVTGANDGSAKLWEFGTGKFIREIGQPSQRVDKLAYRDDKCVVVCIRDGKPSIEIISFRPVAEQS